MTLTVLAFCVGAAVVYTLLGTGAIALLGSLLGIGVPRVEFGLWGPRRTWRIGATEFRISPWWLGGSVTLKSRYTLAQFEGTPGRCFEETSRPKQFLLPIAGCVVLLAMCACILGTGDMLASLVAGFSQLFIGAFAPLSTAQSMLSGFGELLAADPVRAWAVFITKWVGVGLLPFAHGPGCRALLALLPAFDYGEARWYGLYASVTVLGLLAMIASWAVAFVVWLI